MNETRQKSKKNIKVMNEVMVPEMDITKKYLGEKCNEK